MKFDHKNENLRKHITRFRPKDYALSGILNFRNEIGMSDLIFNLTGRSTYASRLQSFRAGSVTEETLEEAYLS